MVDVKIMDRSKLTSLAIIAAGFIGVSAVLATEPARATEIWHVYEALVILAAFVFLLPGAVIGSLLAIAGGAVFLDMADSPIWISFIRITIVSGAIGWYRAEQESKGQEVERLSLVDKLTSLHNYTYFVDRLDEERKRADRFGSRISLIMIDVDEFKNFKDKHGLRAGNELIKHIAEIMKIQVRGVDVVCRYGEEEFAILLPNTGREASFDVAERIRDAVAISDFSPSPGISVRTISGGVATYPDDAGDDLQLIDRVDEALAKAKDAGRNKIVSYGSPKKSEQQAAT